jgi:hypothetical protein
VAAPHPPRDPGRMDLSSGPSAAMKGLLGCLFIVPVLVLVVLLALLAGVYLGAAVSVLVLLGLSAATLWPVMRMFRAAAWLEGTTLVVRGAFTVRRADLATAPHVELDSVPQTTTVPMGNTSLTVPTGRHVPRLTAYGSARRPVRLYLVEGDGTGRRWLAPAKLHALANAISAGARPEPQARQAWWVASGLRAMATDPTGQIR